MASKPKKWPSYALEALENTQAIQSNIVDVARQAQEAMDKGHYLRATILLGDIRDAASRATIILTRSRAGDYQQEG